MCGGKTLFAIIEVKPEKISRGFTRINADLKF